MLVSLVGLYYIYLYGSTIVHRYKTNSFQHMFRIKLHLAVTLQLILKYLRKKVQKKNVVFPSGLNYFLDYDCDRFLQMYR